MVKLETIKEHTAATRPAVKRRTIYFYFCNQKGPGLESSSHSQNKASIVVKNQHQVNKNQFAPLANSRPRSQRKSKVHLRVYFYTQRWAGELVLKEAIHSRPLFYRSRIYYAHTGSQGSHLAQTPPDRAWTAGTGSATHPDQDLQQEHVRAGHEQQSRWYGTWGGKRLAQRRQSGINCFGTQPCLPRQNQAYRHLVSIRRDQSHQRE